MIHFISKIAVLFSTVFSAMTAPTFGQNCSRQGDSIYYFIDGKKVKSISTVGISNDSISKFLNDTSYIHNKKIPRSYIVTVTHGKTINIDSCGIDTNPLLNNYEISFLDSIISDTSFHKNDFINKRVAFISADKVMAKDEFFKKLKATYRGPRGFYFFDKKRKEELGYDAVVMINLKMYSPEQIAEVLKGK